MAIRVSKKIVVLGHFGVGKTSLIRRFVEDSFSNDYKVSIGVHITKKIVEVSVEDHISLILWDLEGTDDLSKIRDSYLLGTHGLIYVFDVSRPSTFQNLLKDLSIVRKKLPNASQIIVGNKIDLVVPTELDGLLQKHGVKCDYFSSAKTGSMVDDLFLHLATILLSDVEKN